MDIDVINEELFTDLCQFLGPYQPKELALQRCNYARYELAWQYNLFRALGAPEEEFYQKTDLYIYDLTLYQINLKYNGGMDKIFSALKTHVPANSRIIEYGGGIGEFSLQAARRGYDISYYDLDGKTREYALWRFNKHNVKVNLNDDIWLNYDVVNIMDVLEHIEKSKSELLIDVLQRSVKYVICNPDEIYFNALYPMHIYDFSKYFKERFTQVEGYLWKPKVILEAEENAL